MLSVRGYYDGTAYVATESARPYKNQCVIITLLDETQTERKAISLEKLESFASFSDGADDAQDYVSKMREDRGF
ncbi:MAG: hypothetical protein ILP18_10610 [Treponema sp.]|nr:hypothetical protein [Treponema sp.]